MAQGSNRTLSDQPDIASTKLSETVAIQFVRRISNASVASRSPAYHIPLVGDVRHLAAENIGTSNLSRVKLLYKGKLLRDDTRPCLDEGLKQESDYVCGFGRKLR